MKQKRILLVEDIESVRTAYKSSLELAGYGVTAVGNLSDARHALNNRTFYVALVDIMLGGEKNTANRDGVEIIKFINQLNEGTLVIPVTGQTERAFVRDTFKELSVFDFLDKHEHIAERGWKYAIERIEAAIACSELDDAPEWSSISETVLLPDEEKYFINETGSITGVQFEIIRSVFSAAVREFQPLRGALGVSRAFLTDAEKEEVVGKFWSKSYGCAVQFVFRKSAPKPSNGNEVGALFLRRKSKLELTVQAIEGANRQEFLT